MQGGNAAWVEAGGLLGRHALREVLKRSLGCIVLGAVLEVVVARYGYDESLVKKREKGVLRKSAVCQAAALLFLFVSWGKREAEGKKGEQGWGRLPEAVLHRRGRVQRTTNSCVRRA